MNIRLTTPVQRDDENSAVELNPGQLESWLDALSVSDIVETVGILDKTISAFNELKVPDSDRLDLLEIYFRAFQKILQGYDEMRIAQLRLPSKQKQQLSNDIMWLHIKLSHGYKIFVKNHSDRLSESKQQQCLLLATFRSLELTVISLLYAYRFGLETPPLTYLELHQLYAFAEYNAMQDKPVKAAKGYAKTPTIASFYVLALVFVSIDPRQYESYTLEVLFLALQPFAFKCPISRAFELKEDSYIYKINLYENEMPVVLANNEYPTANEWARFLDISNFIVEISAWLDENNNKKNTLLIEQELELFPGVVTRLKVNQNERRSSAVEEKVEPIAEKRSKLVIGLSQLESLLITKSIDLGIKLNYKTSDWIICSESSTGCELANTVDEIEEELYLGDLVAVVSYANKDEAISIMNIAHICSLQQLDQGGLLIRLEYIVGTAHPVTYILAREDGEINNEIQFNGVYILNEESDDASLLIVNRKHFKPSQHYVVKTREKTSKVEATKLVKQTLRYSFLQYEILQEEDNSYPVESNILKLAF